MRWHEYVDSLPQEAREALINGVLSGFRHLHDAIGAARTGASTVEVLGPLGMAYGALRGILQGLEPGFVPAAEFETLRHPVVGDQLGRSWHAVLGSTQQQGVAVPAATLATVECHVRSASDAVGADADVTVVQAHLVAGLTAILMLRRSVTAGD